MFVKNRPSPAFVKHNFCTKNMRAKRKNACEQKHCYSNNQQKNVIVDIERTNVREMKKIQPARHVKAMQHAKKLGLNRSK
jgi:uncharacterized protein YueI